MIRIHCVSHFTVPRRYDFHGWRNLPDSFPIRLQTSNNRPAVRITHLPVRKISRINICSERANRDPAPSCDAKVGWFITVCTQAGLLIGRKAVHVGKVCPVLRLQTRGNFVMFRRMELKCSVTDTCFPSIFDCGDSHVFFFRITSIDVISYNDTRGVSKIRPTATTSNRSLWAYDEPL